MAGRRSVLKAVTGMAFCSCCMIEAARAQAPGPGPQAAAPASRLPVRVAGRTIRTIDTHTHCLFHEATDLLGAEAARAVLPPVRGAADQYIDMDARLAAMDAQGIDMQILSINPFWYDRDRELAGKIVETQNRKLAEFTAAHPERFGAFASLTLQYPDLAVQQLDRAMRQQGLRGAAIGASVLTEPFSDPRFHPVWAKAEELGAVLFIHPLGLPELNKRTAGNGWLGNVAAYPVESAMALEHLIFEGVLDKFPNLKVLTAHGGGFLPSYAPRMDNGCRVSPQNCNPAIELKKRPSEYLNQMYYDALVFTPEALRHIVAQVGASQIMLGTDYPFPWEGNPTEMVMATPSLSDEERRGILGGNAARLFGMPA